MSKKFSNPNQHLVDNRVLDEAVYQDLIYYDEPKEYFGLVLEEITKELGEPTSLLDVGCANGAFLHHARKRFPGTELKGMEPLESLATLAHNTLKDIELYNFGLFDERPERQACLSQAVTLLGVLYIFRDPVKVVKHLLELVEDGGAGFIFSPYNEEPIDVLTNYRRAPDGEWQSAHNLFSMVTMEKICADHGVTCRWRDFSLSKPIAKTDDPMRSWTEPFRGDPHHIFYGTNMFSTMKLLVMRKP